MSSRFDLIAQQLINKSFTECTITELEELVQEYPFLAPAQFLLAKKLAETGSHRTRSQMQKAALYYHQPASFDAFLQLDLAETEAFLEQAAEHEEEDEPVDELIMRPVTGFVSPEPEPEFKAPVVEEKGAAEEKNNSETAAAPEPVTAVVTPESSSLPATEATLPSVKLPSFQPMPEPPANAPAFEPFHTVDYFASQGIRLSQEEVTKDKFGKQLKSFTEWLKTMKKLPATEQVKDLDPHAEQKVEHLAAHSVEGSDILTETMAEVWIKQGKWEKAAEVYQKLVLLNPSKKAYFAAKLESLKNKI